MVHADLVQRIIPDTFLEAVKSYHALIHNLL